MGRMLAIFLVLCLLVSSLHERYVFFVCLFVCLFFLPYPGDVDTNNAEGAL